jgi:hypothetical protein
MSGEFKWQILLQNVWRVQVANPAAEFKRQMLVLSDWRVQVTNTVAECQES